MIFVRTSTSGEAAKLGRFLSIGGSVKDRLLIAMHYIGGELEAQMRARATPLHRRSGKLERSFFHSVAVKNGGEMFVLTTGVSKRAFYAAFQDQGVRRKQVDVRSYSRGVRSRDVKQGRKRVASGVGFVTAYRREMYLNPQPFIGVSLEAMRSQIVTELRLAAQGGLRGA